MVRGVLLLAILLLSACALKPAAFPVPASEMPDSPGLLSGQTGRMVIFSR
jgi:hypothetical protein